MRIDDSEKPHGWREVVAGVLAAGLGVQSNKNREHDFKHGSAKQFAIVGVVATLGFVVAVYFGCAPSFAPSRNLSHRLAVS